MDCSKNDCEKVVKQFFDYLDHELCSSDIEKLEKHLEQCRGCFDHVEFERRLRNHIQDSTLHKCPDRVKQKIEDIISKF